MGSAIAWVLRSSFRAELDRRYSQELSLAANWLPYLNEAVGQAAPLLCSTTGDAHLAELCTEPPAQAGPPAWPFRWTEPLAGAVVTVPLPLFLLIDPSFHDIIFYILKEVGCYF